LTLASSTPAPAQPFSTKRPLTHQDYDSWRSIQGPHLSREGKFLAYALTPQEGDGELVVRNLETSKEWRYPLGSRAPALPGAPASSPRRGPPTAPATERRHQFTADSRVLVFQITPTKAAMDQAKKAKKKPEDMPKNALGIMDLTTGQVTRVERVKSFQVPEEGSGFLAYLLEPKPEANQEDKKPESEATPETPVKKRKEKKEYGSDLVLRNLTDHSERVMHDVLEYSFSKDAKSLVYAVSSKQEATNGVFVLTPGTASYPRALLAGKGHYVKLAWDDKQTRLAFLSDAGAAPAGAPRFKLYAWDRKADRETSAGGAAGVGFLPLGMASFTGGPSLSLVPTLGLLQSLGAAEVVSPASPGFRTGWVISDKGALSFSLDGDKLFFGVAPAPPPEHDENKDTAAEDKVTLDLWHWKDDYIQPMQRVRAEQERNRTYRAVYRFADKKFCQLADQTLAEITPADDGRWALGSDDRAYRPLVDYDTTYADYYLVNTSGGSRNPLLRKQQQGPALSPGGKFVLFYDGRNWNSLSVPEGKRTNLTGRLGVPFGIEDFDLPSTPPPYGTAGWVAEDQSVLIYDRYDIWQIAPDGGNARNLTQGLGRKEKIQFRYVRLNPQQKAIDPKLALLLRAENEWTRDSGYFKVRLDGDAPVKLLWRAKNFSPPVKSKKGDVFLFTASTFHDFPDLLVARSDFKNPKKVSDANPQKADLLWGTAELVRFKNADGVPLSGILIKPEDFDPSKKYPMMVYIYEKLSPGLHRFVDPQPGTSINASYYASHGYLVFMPDIVYTTGYPGQSALKCVLPGIQAVVDKGFVDEKAIGIQGHSWGGYQIAFMITQTNRFRAAAAGAPVANMTSAYSGIRWGPGLPRQWQYERSQSRIGGSLWQYPMRFIENSPVFQADRVQTPLLMLHNDADDAVPWYQGIEYFLALRRLGKEAYLCNYNGELHGLRQRANQKDYTMRLQQFFDHHLKGAPKPEWMAQGIPYLQREPEPEESTNSRPRRGPARR
jgi:dipeptidyl aminopeptidase/acylaminoacyl peptidase